MFVLLLVLFLAGFINLYFFSPSKKLYAWLHSLFFKNNKNSSKEAVNTQLLVLKKENTSLKNNDELNRVFATFDKNGDGFITKQELKDSLKNIRIFMTEQEVEETVNKLDSNGDGLIDFEEFCLLCESNLAMASSNQEEEDLKENQEGNLKEAFEVFDRDKDGLISVQELGLVLCSLGLREGKRVEDCKEMIKKVDMDGDGMVNFNEFKKMMTSSKLKL